jgi:hypothetical protein
VPSAITAAWSASELSRIGSTEVAEAIRAAAIRNRMENRNVRFIQTPCIDGLLFRLAL